MSLSLCVSVALCETWGRYENLPLLFPIRVDWRDSRLQPEAHTKTRRHRGFSRCLYPFVSLCLCVKHYFHTKPKAHTKTRRHRGFSSSPYPFVSLCLCVKHYFHTKPKAHTKTRRHRGYSPCLYPFVSLWLCVRHNSHTTAGAGTQGATRFRSCVASMRSLECAPAVRIAPSRPARGERKGWGMRGVAPPGHVARNPISGL